MLALTLAPQKSKMNSVDMVQMNKQHPSGRPRRESRKVERPIWRVPDKGLVTPRLQDKERTEDIGFMARIVEDDDNV